jgi:predicted nucleic acid-binding Zn ribbon protein
MDTADLRQQILKFEKARNNLLTVIAFTVVNLILIAFDAGINFLFSATLPQYIFQLGKVLDSEIGSSIFTIAGLIVAFITIIPYFIFWILAKRARGLILAALIFFGIDSLILLFLILSMEFNFSFLLEIVFHGWILYYLINGVIAWFKMRDVNKDEFMAVLQGIKSNNTIATVSSVSGDSDSDKEIIEEDNSTND